MKRCLFRLSAAVAIVSVIGVIGISFGQSRLGQRRFGGRMWSGRDVKTITPEERNGVPTWEVDPAFKSDVFTFVRVEYDSYDRPRAWMTDFPDSDLNFSFRLQQLTSLKVD